MIFLTQVFDAGNIVQRRIMIFIKLANQLTCDLFSRLRSPIVKMHEKVVTHLQQAPAIIGYIAVTKRLCYFQFETENRTISL